ncbi:hypothetical protein [Desulfobotulus sp.]|jgi:hypothetical protein|uniref:hypothetical protein n=1 Tax=Desulfobotulus sp. TaxID=1940337 RepID=UPI002A361186|nr:hypothetical protein [Desulfobotulus sp.]MDY0162292.1 hypothetical protein [Desulfobotulus sp.]
MTMGGEKGSRLEEGAFKNLAYHGRLHYHGRPDTGSVPDVSGQTFPWNGSPLKKDGKL